MRLIGSEVRRVEDPRLLTGRGRYVDDVRLPRMKHAAFLRSPYAHARVTGVDVEEARHSPGVLGVLTGADIVAMTKPIRVHHGAGSKIPVFHALATDRVRLVGDPVAIVIAESRALAEDATELIEVDYEPLGAVSTFEAAVDPAGPPLFNEFSDNVIYTSSDLWGDPDGAFAEADLVFQSTYDQHRVANVPMETRGAVAAYDPGSGELTLHSSTQSPHGVRLTLSEALGLPVERLTVLAGDVGGGFGLKGNVGREDICVAAASRALGLPVKWIEDRNEHLLCAGHAREESVDISWAVRHDGTLLGLRVELRMESGAYSGVPIPTGLLTHSIRRLFPGPYRLAGYSFEVTVVSTNKCTYVPYRGPWEIETWVRERSLDDLARRLGHDPAELRRRNMMTGREEDRLITGPSIAGITSAHSLERALDLIDYDGFRKAQADARADGRCVGIGFATFIEPAPGPPEMRAAGGPVGGEQARVKVESNGHLVVVTAQAPHGQSHETTLAQVAADEMGVPFEHVRVIHGDTRLTPFSLIGTGGSRASTWASGAVTMATRSVKGKVLAIAGELLEISPEDLEIVDGIVSARGVPHKRIPVSEIAFLASTEPHRVPAGTDHRLESHELFRGEGIEGSGWSGGTHACTVEIDLETGEVKILRWVAAHDCGRMINPAVVQGQIRGGVAQGIGSVLYEHAAYDLDGNFLAGTFMDYLLPTAVEIPNIEIEHIVTDPDAEIGFRGVGEAGAVVAPATLTNAIADALRPYGARVTVQYLPPAKVVELAQSGEAG